MKQTSCLPEMTSEAVGRSKLDVDQDAPPMATAQLRAARVVPRVKTLRTTLGLTQDEFAKRFKIQVGNVAGLGAGARGA